MNERIIELRRNLLRHRGLASENLERSNAKLKAAAERNRLNPNRKPETPDDDSELLVAARMQRQMSECILLIDSTLDETAGPGDMSRAAESELTDRMNKLFTRIDDILDNERTDE